MEVGLGPNLPAALRDYIGPEETKAQVPLPEVSNPAHATTSHTWTLLYPLALSVLTIGRTGRIQDTVLVAGPNVIIPVHLPEWFRSITLSRH